MSDNMSQKKTTKSPRLKVHDYCVEVMFRSSRGFEHRSCFTIGAVAVSTEQALAVANVLYPREIAVEAKVTQRKGT